MEDLHDLAIRLIAEYLRGKNYMLNNLMRLNKRFYSLRHIFIEQLMLNEHKTRYVYKYKPDGWNKVYSLTMNYPDYDNDSLVQLGALRSLSLASDSVTDLSPLHNLERLDILFRIGTDDFAAVPKLKYLSLKNCVKLYALSNVSHIHSIEIHHCAFLNTVTTFAGVHTVSLTICNQIKDFSPLASAQWLRINNCRHFCNESLVALRKVPCWSLYKCLRITDVSMLEDAQEVTLYYCNNILDYSPLGKVTRLNLHFSNITDVSSLGGVQFLDIFSCNQLRDITALESVLNLTIQICRHLPNITRKN